VLPQISVIIPASGRLTLLRTLVSLENQTAHSDQFEVIVVFDGEPDPQLGKLEPTKYPYVLSIRSQTRSGVAAARNHGARESKGTLLLFLDDDLQMKPEFLEQHLNSHQEMDPLTLAFGGVAVDPSSPNVFVRHWAEKRRNEYIEKCEKGLDTTPAYFSGGNFSIAKDSFWKQGGFDESFHGYGWEETDFGVRWREAGGRFHYLKEATAEEMYIKDLRHSSGIQAFETGQNEIRFLKKHPGYRKTSDLRKMFHGNPLRRFMIRIAWSAPRILQLLALLTPLSGYRYRLRYLTNYWSGVKASGISSRELYELFGIHTVVLTYHDITEHPDSLFDVSRQALEKQLRLLKRKGYQAICARDYANWLDSGTPLPAKPILITFDDGYDSFHRIAAPLLLQHGFTAEMFLCPSLVGKENIWDRALGEKRKVLMNWDQISELYPRIHFSAHSISHADLTAVSKTEAWQEVSASGKQIEERLEKPPAFAYPFGRATLDLAQMAAEAGYRCAFTTDEGINTIETDRFLLRRAVVDKWDYLPLFWYKVEYGRTFLNGMRIVVRKMRRFFRATHAARTEFRSEDRF